MPAHSHNAPRPTSSRAIKNTNAQSKAPPSKASSDAASDCSRSKPQGTVGVAPAHDATMQEMSRDSERVLESGADEICAADAYDAKSARHGAGEDWGRARRLRQKPETRAQLLERLTNPTLSLHEAGILLGVCPATVRRYCDAGRLPHSRTTGGQRRFRLHDVVAVMRETEARRKETQRAPARRKPRPNAAAPQTR